VKNSNTTLHLAAGDVLEARFAYRVVAGLSEQVERVEADVAERLRFARDQALERARVARAAVTEPSVVAFASRGAAALRGGSGWWVKLGSVLPLLVLAAGLMLIQQWQNQAQISAAAEIDADLLADDLPPIAYGDAGFAEFLKTPRD
jgi:hypothetical protein